MSALAENAAVPAPRRRRRAKKKPVNDKRQPLNDAQREVFMHLLKWLKDGVICVHPLPNGINDTEIAPLAVAVDEMGQKFIRMDLVPPVRGIPFREALLQAFPEFPVTLYMKSWQWAGKNPVISPVS